MGLQQSKQSVLPPNSIVISKDATSNILEFRWYACYMLYDWNPHHARYAYDNNEFERLKRISAAIGDDFKTSELDDLLTRTYNKVLSEEIEGIIATHLEVMKISRSELEVEMARALAELMEANKR